MVIHEYNIYIHRVINSTNSSVSICVKSNVCTTNNNEKPIHLLCFYKATKYLLYNRRRMLYARLCAFGAARAFDILYGLWNKSVWRPLNETNGLPRSGSVQASKRTISAVGWVEIFKKDRRKTNSLKNFT